MINSIFFTTSYKNKNKVINNIYKYNIMLKKKKSTEHKKQKKN